MRTADRGRAVKMTSLVLAVGLLLFSAICGALAQNSPLVPPLDNALADLYQHAEDLLYQSNDPAAALEEAKKFESEVKKRFGTNNWQYGRALELIGTIYQGMGRTDEAARICGKAVCFANRPRPGLPPRPNFPRSFTRRR